MTLEGHQGKIDMTTVGTGKYTYELIQEADAVGLGNPDRSSR
jgi:hypothetical protein